MTPAAPTPARVDELAIEHNALESKIEEIQKAAKEEAKEPSEKLTKLIAELKALVESFGSAHEKKSKLLSGLEWEMMLTHSSSVGIDNAAVERFWAWAKKERAKKAIVESLFVSVKRWELTPNATVLIQAPNIPLAAKRLFSACLNITPNSPRFKVRPRKKEAQEKTA